jgi:outer membrane protein assembly factor BamB
MTQWHCGWTVSCWHCTRPRPIVVRFPSRALAPGCAAGTTVSPVLGFPCGLSRRSEAHRATGLEVALSVALAVLGCLAPATPAVAQDSAPVTVLDSPLAWQLLQQAEDQAKENPSEAARLCQKLLDGYADRVVPASAGAGGDAGDQPDDGRFLGVTERVEQFLRTHPTVLARYREIEGPEAERLFRPEAPEGVATTRLLTRAGLRATLQLAERDMHDGAFDRALLRLERVEGHPDLANEEGTMYWFLRGACAAFNNRIEEREQAEARLRGLGLADDSPELASITRFAALQPRDVPVPITPLTGGIGPDPSERNWQPVWTESLVRSPFSRLFAVPDEFARMGLPRQIDRARFDGSLLVVAPTVVGDVVYICDGDSIRALDRLSHRTIWERVLESGRIDQDISTISDLSAVAAGEGVVVVLPGHGYVNERGTTARVTCLDAEDGRIRWDMPLALLPGNEFEELFPLGTPVVADGSVYCMARKITSRLETVDYLLAFALESGSLRFATYLAGAGGVNMQGLRPASSPVIADGSVYAYTSAGAVARIDTTNGHIQWLQRFLVPVRNARYQSEPWELGGVAVVGDWVFAIAPNLDTVVQLSRENGRIENTMPTGVGSAWGTPRYLIADEGFDLLPPRVFAVGGDIVAFDPDRPTAALWTFSSVNDESMKEREGVVNRAGIRGRVQCAGETLVVPGLRDVLFLERETGRIQDRIEIDGPANPVLVGAQLVLGMNNSAMAMMPAASAERLMRERIAKSPDDPEGGLALLDLGLRSKKVDLCLEAARHAKAAIERAPGSTSIDRAREELVDRLLGVSALIAPRAQGGEPDERAQATSDAVHELLADVARTPSQTVRHLLAWSDLLAGSKQWDAAIAAVDRVLGEPMLAIEPVARGEDVKVIAATEATERLRTWSSLEDAQAQVAIARRSQLAAERFAAIGSDDAVALSRFARSNVLTDAAVQAAIAAARRFTEQRAFGSAWATVQGVLQTLPSDASHRGQVAALIGAALECAQIAGWTQTGRSFADTVFAELGNLEIPVGAGMTSLNQVRREGQARPARIEGGADSAVGGDSGVARELPGRLVRVVAMAEDATALKGILMAEGQNLVLLSLPELSKVWETPLVDRDPVILDIAPAGAITAASSDDQSTERPNEGRNTAGAILVWQAPSDRDAFASWISLADGSVISRTPGMGEVLRQEALLDSGRPINQQMPSELPFVASEVLPLVTSTMLVVARRNGDIVGFSRSTLGPPVWRREGALDQVYEVGLTDWGIALAGRFKSGADGGAGGGDAAVPIGARQGQRFGVRDPAGDPGFVVLDPSSGEPMSRAYLGADSDVVWMRLLDTGELLLGGQLTVSAYQVLSASVGGGDAGAVQSPAQLWQLESIDTHHSVGAWRAGATIVLAINTELSDAIVALDLTTARERPDRFRAPLRLDNRAPELRAGSRIDDSIVLRYRDRIVAFDLQGTVLGEDAIADEDRDFAALLEAQDSMVVVSNGLPRQIPMSDGSGLRFEYTYTLFRLSGAEGCRLLGPGIRVRTVGQRAERWTLVDGFVIVSTTGGSLAIPVSHTPRKSE